VANGREDGEAGRDYPGVGNERADVTPRASKERQGRVSIGASSVPAGRGENWGRGVRGRRMVRRKKAGKRGRVSNERERALGADLKTTDESLSRGIHNQERGKGGLGTDLSSGKVRRS